MKNEEDLPGEGREIFTITMSESWFPSHYIDVKSMMIDHLHRAGRISDEEWKKWILSEDATIEIKMIQDDI